MKITRVTLATALALSASLAIASGARANDAARGGPSSHRLYSPSGVTPGVISPDGTAGMDRGGFYRDNDTNVYRDGLPRDDVNPHGG
jgi:hypothetical protein